MLLMQFNLFLAHPLYLSLFLVSRYPPFMEYLFYYRTGFKRCQGATWCGALSQDAKQILFFKVQNRVCELQSALYKDRTVIQTNIDKELTRFLVHRSARCLYVRKKVLWDHRIGAEQTRCPVVHYRRNALFLIPCPI